MSEKAYINFSYKSPHEDTETSIGLNPDGSVNIKYTLASMRDLLLHNVDIITKLIDTHENILNIRPIGYDIVEITTNTSPVSKKLLDGNVIRKSMELDDDEAINFDELIVSDHEETNQDRLKNINNIINQNDSQIIFAEDSNSDHDSGDDIIDDETNTSSILEKYGNFINDESDSENSSDNETFSEKFNF
jgi:hypothetical protein